MKVACLNEALLEEWGMASEISDVRDVERWMNQAPHPFAMAYAGHQYGHFTMLGDGRALLVGEWQNASNESYDVHLKGSGPTPFARRGDGHATLHSMLREFLISEALHNLGVPTTRSLMVLETPTKVWRNTDQRGGLLVRVAPHHLRVGTLEYAIRALEPAEYARYAGAVLHRTTQWWAKEGAMECEKSLYTPGPLEAEAVVAFFEEWSSRQAALLADWMRVGFVHGVLNTDNISLLGITMDLGPCAFVNAYDLNRSFSSIDAQGRYAFGNQGKVMEWNAGILLSCLLPLLAEDSGPSRGLQGVLDLHQGFRNKEEKAVERMRWKKLGLDSEQLIHDSKGQSLVDDWQNWMNRSRPDYTQAYLNLENMLENTLYGSLVEDMVPGMGGTVPSIEWYHRWISVLNASGDRGCQEALKRMQTSNPAVVPRNHRVEEALDSMVFLGQNQCWEELLQAFQNPYERHEKNRVLNQPPLGGDAGYCTNCGT